MLQLHPMISCFYRGKALGATCDDWEHSKWTFLTQVSIGIEEFSQNYKLWTIAGKRGWRCQDPAVDPEAFTNSHVQALISSLPVRKSCSPRPLPEEETWASKLGGSCRTQWPSSWSFSPREQVTGWEMSHAMDFLKGKEELWGKAEKTFRLPEIKS